MQSIDTKLQSIETKMQSIDTKLQSAATKNDVKQMFDEFINKHTLKPE